MEGIEKSEPYVVYEENITIMDEVGPVADVNIHIRSTARFGSRLLEILKVKTINLF